MKLTFSATFLEEFTRWCHHLFGALTRMKRAAKLDFIHILINGLQSVYIIYIKLFERLELMSFLLFLKFSKDFSYGFVVFTSESLFHFVCVDAQLFAFSFDTVEDYLLFIFLQSVFFESAGVDVFVSTKRIQAELLKIEFGEELWFILNFEAL